MALNSKSLTHSRRSIKNRSITHVQRFELYVYTREVVKARVREKAGGGGEKAGQGQKHKGPPVFSKPGALTE